MFLFSSFRVDWTLSPSYLNTGRHCGYLLRRMWQELEFEGFSLQNTVLLSLWRYWTEIRENSFLWSIHTIGLVGPGKVAFPGIVDRVGMIRAGQWTFWTWAHLTRVARKDHLLLVYVRVLSCEDNCVILQGLQDTRVSSLPNRNWPSPQSGASAGSRCQIEGLLRGLPLARRWLPSYGIFPWLSLGLHCERISSNQEISHTILRPSHVTSSYFDCLFKDNTFQIQPDFNVHIRCKWIGRIHPFNLWPPPCLLVSGVQGYQGRGYNSRRTTTLHEDFLFKWITIRTYMAMSALNSRLSSETTDGTGLSSE